jgi:hypothetical protein
MGSRQFSSEGYSGCHVSARSCTQAMRHLPRGIGDRPGNGTLRGGAASRVMSGGGLTTKRAGEGS